MSHHGPTIPGGVVERPGEPPDRRIAVVGPLAGRVGVVDDQAEPRSGPRGGPAEHLVVAVGVAERGDRPPADDPLNAHGLARVVVDEVHLRQADEGGLAVADLVLDLDRAADDLLGRDAVDLLGPGPHELDAAAGDDVRLEAVGSQVGEQLQHRLIDQLGVRPLESRVLRRRDPVGDDPVEFLGRHPRVARAEQFEPIARRPGQDRPEVAFESGLEDGLLPPLRMLADLGLDAVQGECDLHVGRLLGPERAVVVEGRDPLGDWDEVRAALLRHLLDERDSWPPSPPLAAAVRREGRRGRRRGDHDEGEEGGSHGLGPLAMESGTAALPGRIRSTPAGLTRPEVRPSPSGCHTRHTLGNGHPPIARSST